MEIQDRNSLLQILTAARDGKSQVSSVEGNLFADILKSSEKEVSHPQDTSKEEVLKPVLQQREMADNVKGKVFDKNETSPKKTEDSHKDTVVSQKEENKPVALHAKCVPFFIQAFLFLFYTKF